jgi:hypothetical protein
MKGVHWLGLGQWPCNLAVVGDEAAYERFRKAYCGNSMALDFPRRGAGNCQQMENAAGDMMLLIAVGKQPSRTEMMLTIAHEAVHAMRFILQFVGEHSPGTETEAYLVEHISRAAFAALTKR